MSQDDRTTAAVDKELVRERGSSLSCVPPLSARTGKTIQEWQQDAEASMDDLLALVQSPGSENLSLEALSTAERLERAGMSHEDAIAEAIRSLGNNLSEF